MSRVVKWLLQWAVIRFVVKQLLSWVWLLGSVKQRRALEFRVRLAAMRSQHHRLVSHNETVQQLPRMTITITSPRSQQRFPRITRNEEESSLCINRILKETSRG